MKLRRSGRGPRRRPWPFPPVVFSGGPSPLIRQPTQRVIGEPGVSVNFFFFAFFFPFLWFFRVFAVVDAVRFVLFFFLFFFRSSSGSVVKFDQGPHAPICFLSPFFPSAAFFFPFPPFIYSAELQSAPGRPGPPGTRVMVSSLSFLLFLPLFLPCTPGGGLGEENSPWHWEVGGAVGEASLFFFRPFFFFFPSLFSSKLQAAEFRPFASVLLLSLFPLSFS